MNESNLFTSRRRTARIAGAYYLGLAMAMFPHLLRSALIVVGDAAATSQHILANAPLFRLSIFGDLACQIAFVFLGLNLYRLLVGVGRDTARTMLALVLVAVPIAMLTVLPELAALAQFEHQNADQAMYFLALFKDGILIAEIFWGLWLFPLGLLFFRSGFMPKSIGILLIFGCFGYLSDAFVGLVFPGAREMVEKGVLVSAAAELSTVFWLLVFGVKRPAKPVAVPA